MNKNIVLGIIVICVLLIPALTGIATPQEQRTETIIKTIEFSKPQVVSQGNYADIMVEQTTSTLLHSGAPLLPRHDIVMTFPLGTEIIDISCTYSPIKILHLPKTIQHCPETTLKSFSMGSIQQDKNQKLYHTSVLYPSSWYSYHTGGGFDNTNQHVTILSLHLYPVRYLSLINSISYITQASVEITYREPPTPLLQPDDPYDLLILTPEKFIDHLQPLVHHKNSIGTSCRLVAVENINTPGRDLQEQIKYYIKNEIETSDIKHVLFVGNESMMPFRYSYAAYPFLSPFVTDLYYADVFDANGSFSSWDTNDNDKFGEIDTGFFESEIIDLVDLYPDIAVGRLLCSNVTEVDVAVKKIRDYENNTFGQDWFNTVVVCGGDTARKWVELMEGGYVFEGEYLGDTIVDIMKGFQAVKLYGSSLFPFRDLLNDAEGLTKENMNSAFDEGAGFVLCSGHGAADRWVTHPPVFEHLRIPSPSGFSKDDVQLLENKGRLPLVVLDACSCADCSSNTGVSSPLAWEFVKNPCGGSIGCMAATTLSILFVSAPKCVEGLSGFMTTSIFKTYMWGFHQPGEMLSQAKTNYLNNAEPHSNVYKDYLIVEECILFGDPSLQLGGI